MLIYIYTYLWNALFQTRIYELSICIVNWIFFYWRLTRFWKRDLHVCSTYMCMYMVRHLWISTHACCAYAYVCIYDTYMRYMCKSMYMDIMCIWTELAYIQACFHMDVLVMVWMCIHIRICVYVHRFVYSAHIYKIWPSAQVWRW